MRRRTFIAIGLVLFGAAIAPSPAAAFEARVARVGVAAARVTAVVELRDLLRDQFQRVVEQGRAVFLQVQANLWEDRRVTDRLALTTPELTYRIDRAPERGVIVTDQFGNRTEHPDPTRPLTVRVDLGPATAVADDRSYYLQADIIAATVADRDIEQAGAAVLGDRESTEALAGLGRFVFRTLLRIGQYLDRASVRVTSDRFSGRAIRSVVS